MVRVIANNALGVDVECGEKKVAFIDGVWGNFEVQDVAGYLFVLG